MNLDEELRYINLHFDNLDPGDLYKQLIKCGLGYISNPIDSGASLIDVKYSYSSEVEVMTNTKKGLYQYSNSDSYREAA